MPIYEYRCGSCGYTFDVRGSFEDAPYSTCPECGGMARRVLHAVGIVFKGSGFYATDNRRPHYGRSGDSSDSQEESSKEEPAKAEAKDTTTSSGESGTVAAGE